MTEQSQPKPARPRTPKPPMAERIKAEQEENPLAHEWVVAAEVAVDAPTAKHAEMRLSFRTQEGMKVDALEVYCRRCRKKLDAVADQSCQAKVDNAYLFGGDRSVRAKRKIPPKPPESQLVKPPSIQRRGLDAVINGYV